MIDYTLKVEQELELWKRKITRRSSLVSRMSKKTQTKVNTFIPEKVHHVISESVKNMVKATLVGSNFTTRKQQATGFSLYERDELMMDKLVAFRKAAVVEGAGTGAGGILLGLADFPLLLSIKMKFLYEVAAVYGFDTNKYEERLFLLHVFQLAFSSDVIRRETLATIENWEQQKYLIADMDWRDFQQEYRDHIDLVKMFQLIPGFGAIVGAFANYNLLDQLGETAKNAYRLRYLKEHHGFR
ncbi:EcsC family protein [Sporosarcina pasteurii]|uniref:EcsC protein family n=1 Tax=Sporosarcina pasteurii TaxID=1474 RepID=A0A380BST4_SPOPA|nr:EcsC family protein [Sporosarcina pasteurii]MDS9471190.1 EcsC family protein [Sporosarcina pasteurii]QBQ05171.1 EcsC family protein [Sporosarcina pasteurii]SUJ05456.1 EcsC protein family [Sporosarcina pasteurii]